MTKENGFGYRMRQRRIELGMSLTDLANALNMPISQASRYETGHREPRADIATHIAKALKVNWEWLLLGKGNKLEESLETASENITDSQNIDESLSILNTLLYINKKNHELWVRYGPIIAKPVKASREESDLSLGVEYEIQEYSELSNSIEDLLIRHQQFDLLISSSNSLTEKQKALVSSLLPKYETFLKTRPRNAKTT